jgi:hypothetical protein
MQVFIEALRVDQIEMLERRMRRGAMSSVGFLADGESLKGVIERDLSTLSHLGLSPSDVADRLEDVIGEACRLEAAGKGRNRLIANVCRQCGWQSPVTGVAPGPVDNCERCDGKLIERAHRGNWVEVNGRWRVTGFDIIVMGHQECPFFSPSDEQCEWYDVSSPWTHPTQDLVIANQGSDALIAVPRIAPHLIREHHFFEGAVEYRVDPAVAADVLALV